MKLAISLLAIALLASFAAPADAPRNKGKKGQLRNTLSNNKGGDDDTVNEKTSRLPHTMNDHSTVEDNAVNDKPSSLLQRSESVSAWLASFAAPARQLRADARHAAKRNTLSNNKGGDDDTVNEKTSSLPQRSRESVSADSHNTKNDDSTDEENACEKLNEAAASNQLPLTGFRQVVANLKSFLAPTCVIFLLNTPICTLFDVSIEALRSQLTDDVWADICANQYNRHVTMISNPNQGINLF